MTGTGGLADKKISASTRVLTKPYLTLGPTKFYEWNRRGWGPCDIYCGFGHSSDTFFYQVAGMLGADRLGYWAEPIRVRRTRPGSTCRARRPGSSRPTQWKQDALGAPMFAGETYQAGIGQGYDAVTPLQLINAFAALANGGTLYQPQIVHDVVGPDGTVVRPFEPKVLHEMEVKKSVLKTMRKAARETVTAPPHLQPRRPSDQGRRASPGPPSSARPDAKGRLPYSSWFVGFTPKDPVKGSFDKADSELVVLAFAHDSRTKGNAATEIVKYFLQLHYDIDKDYRTAGAPRARQLLHERLMGVIRAEPARVTDWAAKSVGAAWRAFDLQLPTYAVLLAATGLAMAYHQQRRERVARRWMPGRPSPAV